MSEFSPRLTIPPPTNKYYIPKSEGGLNPGIAKPNGSKLQFSNCVFYALGRYAELWKIWLESTNAENFANVAKKLGLTVSQNPALGAIACWAKGEVGNGSDGAGHVACVEVINDSGSIVTSESGWNASKAFWTQTRKNDGNWGQNSSYKFLGFILPPGANAHSVLREGSKGDEVTTLQTILSKLGYYYEDKIDGDFGLRTFGAVLAFQKKNGLSVDGVCGPMTWRCLGSKNT